METKGLGARGAALEAAYIRQIEERRLQHLRAEARRDHTRAELGAELEIDDLRLLDRLIGLGIHPDTAPAFEALPLVEVAWADGRVDTDERWTVLTVATAFGLELGRPAHAQLELWLTREPDSELFDAWHEFAATALTRPSAASRARRTLEGVREVAEAAGGILGFGATSASERVAIEGIRRTLRAVLDPDDATALGHS